MEWVIEALRVLREVRDWTRSRADTGVKRAERTHDAIEKATQRVEQVVGADPGTLVSPIGPASIPAIARTPTRNAERRSTRRDPPSRRHEIPIDQIDSHAISAVRRLRQHGYKAYLVGGCVRDLLLGLTPKDVDVSTDARPEEIKRVFRNSRIIGRRFRLVHLYYHGGKIIEVATFRANLTPDEDNVEEGQDLLVRRDNVFGTEEEDALRRDFTINGLFYDVHSGRIIDHVGGVEDVRQRYLRMIGDPEIRLREDPVRILRAVRFTAKANLRIDPELREAMRRHTSEVVRCAPARVLEETLKLLRTGQAAPSIRLMDELGLLEVLLPEIKAYLDGVGLDENDPEDALEQRSEALYAHLEALDDLVHLGQVSDVVILASLASAPLQAFLQEHDQQDPVKLIVDFLAVFAQRIALTRKLSESIRQALMMQRQLTRRTEPESGKRRRRRPPAPEALMSRGAFADALNLFDIQCHARELPMDEVEQWYDRVEEHVGQPVERPLDRAVLGPADDEERPRRRRRSRRRR